MDQSPSGIRNQLTDSERATTAVRTRKISQLQHWHVIKRSAAGETPRERQIRSAPNRCSVSVGEVRVLRFTDEHELAAGVYGLSPDELRERDERQGQRLQRRVAISDGEAVGAVTTWLRPHDRLFLYFVGRANAAYPSTPPSPDERRSLTTPRDIEHTVPLQTGVSHPVTRITNGLPAIGTGSAHSRFQSRSERAEWTGLRIVLGSEGVLSRGTRWCVCRILTHDPLSSSDRPKTIDSGGGCRQEEHVVVHAPPFSDQF